MFRSKKMSLFSIYRACVIIVYVTYVTCADEVKHVSLKGDFLLGAMFPIHTLGGDGKCGYMIDQQIGIQNLEAMLYSREKANKHILGDIGVTIGVVAYDSCRSETVSMETALDIVQLKPHVLGVDAMFKCNDNSLPTLRDPQALIGVVGAAASNVCMQLASFFRLFQIPQISYIATSPELSDRSRYEYFMRTVASDTFQSQAIVATLNKFNWTYVVGIYEDTQYGRRGFEEVKQQADSAGICIGKAFKMGGYFHNETTQREEISEILKDALRFNNTEGKIIVILFMLHDRASVVFDVSNKLDGGERFVWVGSDGWTGLRIGSHGKNINNSIGVQHKVKDIVDFNNYFTSLTLEEHRLVNPWFSEYWEQLFNCSISSSGGRGTKKLRQCTGTEKIQQGIYEKNLNTYTVMDAVYSFAYALKALHKEKCGGKSGVCELLRNSSHLDVKPYLEKVRFKGVGGNEFQFINGSGPVRYSIMKFIQHDITNSWTEIGEFELQVEDNHFVQKISFSDLSSHHIPYKQSICSLPCKPGEAKLYTNVGIKCCWKCTPCEPYQYLQVSNQSCVDCLQGYRANATQTGCVPLPEETMDMSNVWAIISMVLTCIGFIVTVIVAVIFYLQKETPLIMASGKELSFVLLLGILMSYVSTFAFVSYPARTSCAITRVMLGLSYTICYASVLVKTNRIYRVFNIHTSKPKKVKHISAKSQLLITFSIVGVEIIALGIWLILEPAKEALMYPTRLRKVRVCEDALDYAYLGALAYPFVLMILCIYYAIRTRKTPDGFNETRYITFGSYSFCVLWIAFTSIYFSVDNTTIRIVSLCFASIINATVTLITLFITKTYVVVFRPQKNTRENVMARRRTHSYDTVNINSINNVSRLPSAVSTWHSVNPVVLDSEDSLPQTITIGQKPKFGNKLSVSVLSVNNVDHYQESSIASNINIDPMSNNIDQDIVLVTEQVKKTSVDLGDERLQQFLESKGHHHQDSNPTGAIGQSVPRRSYRSFKSKRKRNRTLKRAQSLDGVNGPHIVITPPFKDVSPKVVHL